jgi:hypothetical protein
MKGMIFLFFLSLNAFGGIWIPHEKVIWSLIRKAEFLDKKLIKSTGRSPEEIVPEKVFKKSHPDFLFAQQDFCIHKGCQN